jgi:hypothetical protein
LDGARDSGGILHEIRNMQEILIAFDSASGHTCMQLIDQTVMLQNYAAVDG